MNNKLTYQDYVNMVKSPGKFQGVPPYVPYYYELSMNGGPDEYIDDAMSFVVQSEDTELFPELVGKHNVTILELDDGFVIEV